MKKIVLIILIFLNIQLFASDYTWSASINKKSALINEAIHLKYVCEFKDEGLLYTIDFNPAVDTEGYELILLKEDEKRINNKRVNSYEFVAFAKKSGKLDFDLEMIMKKTTIDSIREMTGGLDNDKANEGFTSEYLKQKTLSININKSETSLVGDFKLEVKKDKTDIKAFSPYHLEVIIKGLGNFKDIKTLKIEIDGVRTFAQKPTLKTTLSKDGYEGIWSQKFALVSEKDFILPAIEIKYTDSLDAKIKTLKTKLLDIKVSPSYEKKILLDKVEDEPSLSLEFLYYIFTFIFGYIIGKIFFVKEDLVIYENLSFEDKVQNAESIDRLLILLVLQDSQKYKNLIIDIENKKVSNINKCKKEIIKYSGT